MTEKNIKSKQQIQITFKQIELALTEQKSSIQGKHLSVIINEGDSKIILKQNDQNGSNFSFKGPQKIIANEGNKINFNIQDASKQSQNNIGRHEVDVKEFKEKENTIQFDINQVGKIKVVFQSKIIQSTPKENVQKPVLSNGNEKNDNNALQKQQNKQAQKSEPVFQGQNQSKKQQSNLQQQINQIGQNKISQSKSKIPHIDDQKEKIQSNKQIIQENSRKPTERSIKRKTQRSQRASQSNIVGHSKKQSDNNITQNYQSQNPSHTQQQHQQRSLQNQNSFAGRSRNTFKLPNIGQQSRNFGDRIFEKQSSSTLQKSILVFSMPKAPRFGSGPKYSGQLSYYVDTCFKPNSTKGVGFGFGNKRQFPEWMERNMKENPSPGAYFDTGRRTEFRSKGPTFGISHKHYEKVTIPKQTSKDKSFLNKSNQRLKPLQRK